MQKLSFFGQFILDNPGYLSMVSLHPKFTHTMTVARYRWGYAIETDSVDEDGIVTLEFLTSLDGIVALLVHRERQGDCHDEMRSYRRDSEYPVGNKVYLKGKVPC
jgi:hypothetical protein